MKILKQIFCCFMMTMILSGCGQTSDPEPTPAPTEPPTESPVPEVTETPAPTVVPEPELLAAAKTELLDKTNERVHNILLAIKQINGLTLEPGESFSFNSVVGERTAARGYEKASVLINHEKKQDYGGGVCQVSSTLFQAARSAGLEVIERHSHQKDVGYAHQGDDAAVDYGNKDLRFKNSLGSTIEISLSAGGGMVYAEIYKLPE